MVRRRATAVKACTPSGGPVPYGSPVTDVPATGGTERRGRGRPARYSLEGLLDVVVEEFNARGYDATSMEDIARATGLTKSSVYHHVSGKEELLRLAVGRALDALYAVLDEPGSTSGAAIDRLEHVVRRSVDVLAAELPYVTLLLRVRGNTAAEREALERRREFDRRLAARVGDAIDAGEVRDDLDPRVVARLLFGAVNSVAEWYRADGGHGAADVADALVTLTFDGLRTSP
jgi:AcrR family transcriptional regulator